MRANCSLGAFLQDKKLITGINFLMGMHLDLNEFQAAVKW